MIDGRCGPLCDGVVGGVLEFSVMMCVVVCCTRDENEHSVNIDLTQTCV